MDIQVKSKDILEWLKINEEPISILFGVAIASAFMTYGIISFIWGR